MTSEEKAALYYCIVRRFPPKTSLTGQQLDEYCHSMLKADAVRERVWKDLERMCYSTTPETYGFAYEQRNEQE